MLAYRTTLFGTTLIKAVSLNSGQVTNDKMFVSFISDISKQFILKPLFTGGVLSLDKNWPSGLGAGQGTWVCINYLPLQKTWGLFV